MQGFMTPSAFLEHWQGHRRLTRRMIEAFPADKLSTFSVGEMRPFGALVMEFLGMAVPMVRGVVTGTWDYAAIAEPRTKEGLLALWDAATVELNALWPKIRAEQFHETITAFGAFTGRTHDLLLYVVDNEIHHRAQASVYLRALGIKPPEFPDRS